MKTRVTPKFCHCSPLGKEPVIYETDSGKEIARITLSGYTVGREASPVEWGRLLAAAPELLEAAKLGLKIAESLIHDQLDGTSSLKSELETLNPIKAAITNAEVK